MGLKPDTKGILAASLEELLEKHDYEEITVDAITKNCGAARATFYRHFKDKQDLMQWTYISQAEKVEEIFASPAQWDRAVAQGLDLVQKKRAFLRAALEYKRQNPFMDFWYQNSLAYLQSLLARGLGPGDPVCGGQAILLRHHRPPGGVDQRRLQDAGRRRCPGDHRQRPAAPVPLPPRRTGRALRAESKKAAWKSQKPSRQLHGGWGQPAACLSRVSSAWASAAAGMSPTPLRTSRGR